MRNLNNLILILFLCYIPVSLLGQKKEKDFEQTVYTLLNAFAEKDQQKVNSFINKDVKLVSIFRIGAANNFCFLDSLELDWSHEIVNYRPIEVPKLKYKIKYGRLPEFSCGTEVWDKPYGLYCDKSGVDSVFSSTIRHFMTYEMGDMNDSYYISEAQYMDYKKMEKQSRKLILLMEGGDNLAFSLTWIKNKWYLTILDRVAGDCSA